MQVYVSGVVPVFTGVFTLQLAMYTVHINIGLVHVILHMQIKFMGVARAFLLWPENEDNVHMLENMRIFLQYL